MQQRVLMARRRKERSQALVITYVLLDALQKSEESFLI